MSTKRPFDWVPTPSDVAQSNLTAFLQRVGAPDCETLLERADADPAWLMHEVFGFCDFRFYQPYAQLLDVSRGIEWARWCVGGTTNIVLNCLDRHRGTPVWEQTFLVWEGEDPQSQRQYSYREFDAERVAADDFADPPGGLQALVIERHAEACVLDAFEEQPDRVRSEHHLE